LHLSLHARDARHDGACPADAIEGEAIIRWATEYDGPVVSALARDACPTVFDEQYRFVLGGTISLREGGDVLMIRPVRKLPAV
jgi:transketolase C-terminal domain/subunit